MAPALDTALAAVEGVKLCHVFENARRPLLALSYHPSNECGFHHSTLLLTERGRWSDVGGNKVAEMEEDQVWLQPLPGSGPAETLEWMQSFWTVVVEPGAILCRRSSLRGFCLLFAAPAAHDVVCL